MNTPVAIIGAGFGGPDQHRSFRRRWLAPPGLSAPMPKGRRRWVPGVKTQGLKFGQFGELSRPARPRELSFLGVERGSRGPKGQESLAEGSPQG
jgi:hypothetical protein